MKTLFIYMIMTIMVIGVNSLSASEDVYLVTDGNGDSYCISDYMSGTVITLLMFKNKDILDKKECGFYNSDLYHFPNIKNKIKKVTITNYILVEIK